MTKVEVVRKINELTEAIEDYRRLKENGRITLETLLGDTLTSPQSDIGQAMERCMESYNLMASGTPCPRCKGTGRI